MTDNRRAALVERMTNRIRKGRRSNEYSWNIASAALDLALEEAARVVADMPCSIGGDYWNGYRAAMIHAADAIRALKGSHNG